MSRKTSNYKKILKSLEELHRLYPHFAISQHLATALDDYGDFWGISDEEFLFALDKYKTTLELDHQNIASDDYVQKIIKDSENFDDLINENDEYED